MIYLDYCGFGAPSSFMPVLALYTQVSDRRTDSDIRRHTHIPFLQFTRNSIFSAQARALCITLLSLPHAPMAGSSHSTSLMRASSPGNIYCTVFSLLWYHVINLCTNRAWLSGRNLCDTNIFPALLSKTHLFDMGTDGASSLTSLHTPMTPPPASSRVKASTIHTFPQIRNPVLHLKLI